MGKKFKKTDLKCEYCGIHLNSEEMMEDGYIDVLKDGVKVLFCPKCSAQQIV